MLPIVGGAVASASSVSVFFATDLARQVPLNDDSQAIALLQQVRRLQQRAEYADGVPFSALGDVDIEQMNALVAVGAISARADELMDLVITTDLEQKKFNGLHAVAEPTPLYSMYVFGVDTKLDCVMSLSRRRWSHVVDPLPHAPAGPLEFRSDGKRPAIYFFSIWMSMAAFERGVKQIPHVAKGIWHQRILRRQGDQCAKLLASECR